MNQELARKWKIRYEACSIVCALFIGLGAILKSYPLILDGFTGMLLFGFFYSRYSKWERESSTVVKKGKA